MRLFCFGLGYAAGFVAKAFKAHGGTVYGTHRNGDDNDTCFIFSAEQELSAGGLSALKKADAVLISIPPDSDGDPVFHAYADVLKRSRALRWLGVFSTTGVYGDHGGNWVDETTPAKAETPRAAHRLMAEQQWLGTSLPTHIFRLSGIYGPGRSALERAAENAPLLHKAGHVFNRIHVADIAQAVMASIARPTPREVYNLSDDLPAAGDDVLRYAYELLDIAMPQSVNAETALLSPMAKEFYAECKRVRNSKIKSQLGLKWLFPTYREGLAALHHNL